MGKKEQFNDAYISHLLVGHISKSLNHKEQGDLEIWIQLSEENSRTYRDLSDAAYRDEVYKNQQSYDASKALSRIKSPTQKRPSKLASLRLIGIAASFLIICATAVYLYRLPLRSTSLQEGTKTNLVAGTNKAVLTLADGKKITLNGATQRTIAMQGNAQVSQTADGTLQYKQNSERTIPSLQNKVTTPRGGQYHLVLSDGTKVWLNAESSLQYPVAFEQTRTVDITGEAYFEVAHDASRPFKVQSSNQVVEVLGTRFNINSYPEEAGVVTTLIEGRVNVKALNFTANRNLNPGQQSLLTPQKLSVADVDPEAGIAWKNGYFRFENAGIKEVMSRLSRWYDFDVILSPDLAAEQLNGTISRDKTLKQALSMLEYTNGIRFKVEGRRITVMK